MAENIPYSSQVIRSDNHDFEVMILNFGEHHMGASTIIFEISWQFEGVDRFKTTNGYIFFTREKDRLFIGDAEVILYFNLTTKEVFNLTREKVFNIKRHDHTGRYFCNVRLEGDYLKSDLYGGSGVIQDREINPIPISKIENYFTQGYGHVIQGQFPSAW